VRAPTLLVAGELDMICGPAQARPIADVLPNVELVILADCGHIPAVEGPNRFRAAVADSLSP
jgi:pimeloyl-ACP methyl ester carboxylesterase